MTRFFYTDPLAAAWMAKHFGMRFENLAAVIAEVDGDTTLLALPKFVNDCRNGRRFYIHTDSLPILEPKTGDLMEHDASEDDRYAVIHYDAGLYCERHGVERVVLRNGVAFHWPESEAA